MSSLTCTSIARTPRVIVLIEFITSGPFLYIYDYCLFLEFIMTSSIFAKIQRPLVGQNRVPPYYKLHRVKEVSRLVCWDSSLKGSDLKQSLKLEHTWFLAKLESEWFLKTNPESVSFNKRAAEHQVLSTLIDRHHFFSRMSLILHNVKKGQVYATHYEDLLQFPWPDRSGAKLSRPGILDSLKLSKVLMRLLLKCLSVITNLYVDTW